VFCKWRLWQLLLVYTLKSNAALQGGFAVAASFGGVPSGARIDLTKN
jgi:hypothetical protein